MKKLLRSLTTEKLASIARDYSFQDLDRKGQIDALAGYFGSYGIRATDVISRYSITTGD
jgi:hypothetical protein